MGKDNRTKAHEQIAEVQFPFHLLQSWLKPVTTPEHCRCGKSGAIAAEHYIDIFTCDRLHQEGASKRAAVDAVWNKARDEQMAGRYVKYGMTIHCEHCAHRMLANVGGENTANMLMMLMAVGGKRGASIVTGYTLKSMDDEGVPFSSLASQMRTIQAVAQQLKGEVLHINLKK